MDKAKKIIVLLYAVVMSFFVNIYPVIENVYGVVKYSSNVLDDLKQDENFNESDYPEDLTNHKLELITIAESTDYELFVYIYNPSHNVYANYIVMRLEIDENSMESNVYILSFLNESGVFQKYVVLNTDNSLYEVSHDNTVVHFYEITTIHRPYNRDIDESKEDYEENLFSSENDNGTNAVINNVNTVCYPVNKKFSIALLSNGVYMSAEDVRFITITDKFCGYVKVPANNSFGFLTNKSVDYDIHFIAFSTDKQIDKLLSATVYFKTQLYTHRTTISNGVHYYDDMYDNPVSNNVILDYEHINDTSTIFEVPNHIWGQSYTYSYPDIQEPVDFIDTFSGDEISICKKGIFNYSVESEFDAEAETEILTRQFVLNYYIAECSRAITGGLGGRSTFITDTRVIVSETCILRLMFECDGIVYNLGVIDNMSTGSSTPVNNYDVRTSLNLPDLGGYFTDFMKSLSIVLGVIVLIAVLPMIINVLGFIIKIPIAIIKFIRRLLR